MKLIALLAVALAVAGSTASAAPVKPSVRVVTEETTIAVAGHGFKSGEKVRVLVFHSGVRIVKRVSATATGTFRFRVSVGVVDTCVFSYVSAIGERGSRATVRHVPAPCGPPIAP